MNDQLSKESESMNKFPPESMNKFPPNYIESMGSREPMRRQNLRSRRQGCLQRPTTQRHLKSTRDHKKWIQQLLHDTKKTILRVIGKSETSEDNTDGIKKTCSQK